MDTFKQSGETYTTLTSDGSHVLNRGIDSYGVVFEALVDDGGSYEVRREDDGEWHLYSKKLNDRSMTEARGWTQSVSAADADEAEKKLFAEAFNSGLPGARINFMTDAEYDAMMAEAENA